ncbi:MAG: hypothetical protein KIT84_23095 [Labilithrix sp.]|nr:hypothetical protein [Labilithrix sp.]MCW5813933.1 hypothetical protein [Labilithrix sp.]
MTDEKRPKIDAVDPDAPPSEEEVAESKKLRDALARGDDPIANALKAAWEPEPLAEEAHARIVDGVTLDDPLVHALRAAWNPAEIRAEDHARIIDDVPTAEELKLAALVDDDELVHALEAAWNPAALDPAEHRRIVDRATAGAVVQLRPARRRLGVAIVTTTTVFALAAGVVLWITAVGPSGPKGEVALARARSTQPLFDEPFKAGETSARIDRIALARSSDYRDNYFARRGVR